MREVLRQLCGLPAREGKEVTSPERDSLGGEQDVASRSRILDVGTRIAALAVGYAEAFPQAQVLGIDILDRAPELAA
jgi:methylase of polypeptide subunit release factors